MRLFGFILTLAVLLLLAKNIFAAEKPIAVDVQPRVTISDPYNRRTFRVRITIPKHPDNKLLSYSASCGQEIRSSQYEIDKVTFEWFEELTVTDDCIFQACLHRAEKGKIQNYCVYQEVKSDAYDPDPTPY